ncbi:hepatocellular carcinoma-associated antigen 59-domain-containing protein [Halteromyces radiatus]|uniref:hepatocellular carcinoma-associated antigen 59-domain-containing protein n=1 Tax=Halteromyces radiatus TaxID=101107 RepID=UPI00221E3EB5|nr:hepatocellular carcinoma-associated antigen 59-domain-containing protein [Halteromyces radiatus]KAI8081700.1 hepatocellular carcinoma-associated antigen 59-domain-containing protein [Halteromyces radiatus]
MAISKKTRNYRKKVHESDEETAIDNGQNIESTEDVSHTIEELQELRQLRRKHGGVDAEKLLKGDSKKKTKPKKPVDDGSWSLQKGGLVDKDAFAAGKTADDEEGKGKKVRLDTFTSQTNKLDVDKHMMKYIETELRKKRGGDANIPDDEEEESNEPQGMKDIYEELYHLPDHLKFASEVVKEGNVQHSTQMLTAIPEVDLGISAQLKNIENTERAKRKLMEDKETIQQGKKKDNDFFLLILTIISFFSFSTPRSDRRQWATDEVVAERFKKRMRK